MRRLYASLVVTLVVLLATMGWFVDQYFHNSAQSNQSRERLEYASYVALANKLAVQLPALSMKERELHIERINELELLDVELVSTSNFALPKDDNSNEPRKEWFVELPMGRFLLIQLGDEVLKVALPNVAEEQPPSAAVNVVLYLLLCLIVGLWLIPLVRKIDSLNNAFNSFAKGQLATQVKTKKTSYLYVLESGFNRMARQISELVGNNRLMANALSHDLKHPISCLEFSLASLSETTHEDDRTKHLQRMEGDIQRLNSILGTYLEFSRVSRRDVKLDFQKLDLNSLLREMTQTPSFNASFNSVLTFNLICSESALVEIDIHWFKRCLMNIFQNSIDHGSTQIELTLLNEGGLRLIIEDNGTGLAPEYWQQVFEPFTSLNEGRGNNHGLGLSIVRKIIEWHGGSIEFMQPQKLSGAAIIIALPLKC